MKRLVLIALLPLLTHCTSVQSEKAETPLARPNPDFHLFLLAGQSNMAGRGEIDPTENEPIPGILMLGRNGEWIPAVHPIHYDKSSAGVGLAKSFAETVLKANPGITIGLIPTACGGSPIEAWQPGGYHSQTESHPYDDAIHRTLRAMQDGELKAILWHQGESDCTPERAPLYRQRLEAVFSRFRADLNANDVPIFLGQLGQFDHTPLTPWRKQVNRAHEDITNQHLNIHLIRSNRLTSKDDKIHFDTPSLERFGKRYANSYLAVEQQ